MSEGKGLDIIVLMYLLLIYIIHTHTHTHSHKVNVNGYYNDRVSDANHNSFINPGRMRTINFHTFLHSL